MTLNTSEIFEGGFVETSYEKYTLPEEAEDHK